MCYLKLSAVPDFRCDAISFCGHCYFSICWYIDLEHRGPQGEFARVISPKAMNYKTKEEASVLNSNQHTYKRNRDVLNEFQVESRFLPAIDTRGPHPPLHSYILETAQTAAATTATTMTSPTTSCSCFSSHRETLSILPTTSVTSASVQVRISPHRPTELSQLLLLVLGPARLDLPETGVCVFDEGWRVRGAEDVIFEAWSGGRFLAVAFVKADRVVDAGFIEGAGGDYSGGCSSHFG
jgi:hypothetical protein